MAAILPWFGRDDSKLKVKLLYEKAFDNWLFGQYMYFAAAVIKVSKSKYIEKNCKFEMLYLQKCLCGKSGCLGDNKL